MNNTEKLIASNMLVKQSKQSFMAALNSAKTFGRGMLHGAGHSTANLIEALSKGKFSGARLRPNGLNVMGKHMGSLSEKQLNLFIRGSLLGNYLPSIGAVGAGGLGAMAGIHAAGKGVMSGINKAKNFYNESKSNQQELQQLQQAMQQRKDQGYFGRLLDAITNKGY